MLPTIAPSAYDSRWQIRVYNRNGVLVDLPRADIIAVDGERLVNGGAGQLTITFQRDYDRIGALDAWYTIQIWLWPADIAQPADPYWSGYITEIKAASETASGSVEVHCAGDFSLLDQGIVSEQYNPGVPSSSEAGAPLNPNLDCADVLRHLFTTYGDPTWKPAQIPASMFNLLPAQFDGQPLGSVIDTLIKSGLDVAGRRYVWRVETNHKLEKTLVVELDQNPNTVAGVAFRPIFVQTMLAADGYAIDTRNDQIKNVVSVHGGKDPQTGNDCLAVELDQDSVNANGAWQEKISVPALLSNDACTAYGKTWLEENANPSATGEAVLLRCDPSIREGVWVQFNETPQIGSSPAVIKQMRCASVKFHLEGELIEQTLAPTAPVPYLDQAVYRLGRNVARNAASVSSVKVLAANTQAFFIRYGGNVSSIQDGATPSVTIAAGEAVFPSGTVDFAGATLTLQHTFTVPALGTPPAPPITGAPIYGPWHPPTPIQPTQTATPQTVTVIPGAYSVMLNVDGSLSLVYGNEPPNSPTQLHLARVIVLDGLTAGNVQVVDRRTINVSATSVNTTHKQVPVLGPDGKLRYLEDNVVYGDSIVNGEVDLSHLKGAPTGTGNIALVGPDGKLLLAVSSALIQDVIGDNGSGVGEIDITKAAGLLPYANFGVQFTSTIQQQPNAIDGTYLQGGAVNKSQIASGSIASPAVAQTRYDTTLANQDTGTAAYSWATHYHRAILTDGASRYWRIFDAAGGALPEYVSGLSANQGQYVNASAIAAALKLPDGSGGLASNAATPTGLYGPLGTGFSASGIGVSFEAVVFLADRTNYGTVFGVGQTVDGTGALSGYSYAALAIDSKGVLYGHLWDGSMANALNSGTALVPVGRWVHLAVTMDPTLGRALYIDGQLVATSTDVAYTPPAAGTSLFWATSAGANNVAPINGGAVLARFTGNIGRVAAYALALTASQVGNHAKALKTYYYDVGPNADPGSAPAATSSLYCAPQDALTFNFKHAPYKAGGGAATVAFTGSSATQGPPAANTAAANGSSAPSITHTTSTTYADTEIYADASGTGSPAIVATHHTGTNYPSESSTPSGSGSNASITSGTTDVAGTPTTANNTTSYAAPPSVQAKGGTTVTVKAVDITSSYVPAQAWYNDTSYILSLSVTGPSGFTYTGAATDSWPNGASWAFTAPTDGTYTFTVTRGSTTLHNAQPDSSAAANNSSVTYTPYTVQTTYTGNNGAITALGSTDASTQAPTSSTYQLSAKVTALNAPSDSHGSTQIDLLLYNPSGALVTTFANVTNGTTYNYSAAGAPAGAWSWKYRTTVKTVANNGTTASYAGTVSVQLGWFDAVPFDNYTYAATPGATKTFTTPSSTEAPVDVAHQLELNVTAATLPSDANGSTALDVTLLSPSGATVGHWTLTAPGTLTYSAAGAAAGAYTWQIIPEAIVGGSPTTTGTDTYAVSWTATHYWYQNVATTTTTYANNDGAATTLATPTNTVAPTTTGTALSMAFSSVTAPSNAYGTSSVRCRLKDPSGNYVVLAVSTDGGTTWTNASSASGGVALTAAAQVRYYDAAAIAGAYTWVLDAFCTANATGDSSYSDSWTAIATLYLPAPQGGGVFVLSKDGLLQRSGVNDGDVAFTRLDSEVVAFQVQSSQPSVGSNTTPLAFTLGVSVAGL